MTKRKIVDWGRYTHDPRRVDGPNLGWRASAEGFWRLSGHKATHPDDGFRIVQYEDGTIAHLVTEGGVERDATTAEEE